jgi:hypothetical protein
MSAIPMIIERFFKHAESRVYLKPLGPLLVDGFVYLEINATHAPLPVLLHAALVN